MSETETTPADLGALIETYRPIEQGLLSIIWDLTRIGFIYFGIILIIMAAIIILPSIIFRGVLAPEWFGDYFIRSAVLAGLIALVIVLIGVISILGYQAATRQGFHVDIHENGFCVYELETVKQFYWREITEIRTYVQRYRCGIIIRSVEKPPFEISCSKIADIDKCGQELEKRWRANQKGAWMFERWNMGA
jgi:hypothetical protein